ncbi:MAG: nicotinate-nucleotide adenylyltransferase [Desulfuromonadales bacterium]|nr:nicotinate-nucleotide adenylyltransferase [Desulfuromonadales bacterium]
MKIGIIGGTFNPIHFAHLRIAEEVREQFELEKIIFMPSAIPPHKELDYNLSFEHRFNMVSLAIKENPFFELSDIEQKLGGTSYSVDTLSYLKQQHQKDELFFVIGSDSFIEISSWYKYEELFKLCNIIVVERPGYAIDDLSSPLIAIKNEFCYDFPTNTLKHSSGFRAEYFKGCPLDISSSFLRNLAQKGASLRYLVPQAVAEYIYIKRIYTNAP